MKFGPDGNLYVASVGTGQILRYNGTTGQFMDVFVPKGSGGLQRPGSLVFGPDGNLYVSTTGGNSVLRFNRQTGAFIDTFVSPGSGGLFDDVGLVFGPNGNLYVNSGDNSSSVFQYNGITGALIGQFVSTGAGGGVNSASLLDGSANSGSGSGAISPSSSLAGARGSAVPEPPTMVMFAVALAVLLGYSRHARLRSDSRLEPTVTDLAMPLGAAYVAGNRIRTRISRRLRNTRREGRFMIHHHWPLSAQGGPSLASSSTSDVIGNLRWPRLPLGCMVGFEIEGNTG